MPMPSTLLCFLIILLNFARGENVHPVNSYSDLLDLFQGDVRTVVVKFYAPWCGHCQAFAPDYDSIAQQVLTADDLSPTKFAKVDCTDVPELKALFNISSYPSLFFLSPPLGGKFTAVTQYSGERAPSRIVSFLRVYTSDLAFLSNSEKEVRNFVSSTTELRKTAIVAYVDEDFVQDYEVAEVAKELAWSENMKLVVILGTRQGENGFLVTHPDASERWLNLRSLHQIAQRGGKRQMLADFLVLRGQSPFAFYDKKGLIQSTLVKGYSFVFLFIDDIRYAGAAFDVFKEVQEKNVDDSIAFIVVPSYEESVQKEFGLSKNTIPAVVLLDARVSTSTPLRFVRPFINDDVSSEVVISFYMNVKNGNGREYRTLRSTPVLPQHSEGPLYEVVGANFQQLILDRPPGTDSLVMFYAPWCKHSNKFTNDLRLMGRQFKRVNSLDFFRIDHSVNEIDAPFPLEISGYPTLYMISTIDHQEYAAKKFTGTRNFDTVLQFINESIVFNFTLFEEAYGPVLG